jgi:hypothetical protein
MPVKYARFDSDRFKLAVSDMHAGNSGMSPTLDPAARRPQGQGPASLAWSLTMLSRTRDPAPPATPAQAAGLGRESGARPPERNGGIQLDTKYPPAGRPFTGRPKPVAPRRAADASVTLEPRPGAL